MTQTIQSDVSCQNCEACCCRLEVMLFTDTGVPDRYIEEREGEVPVMHRLEDGWCAALDRNTMMCRIYEVRPLICREFEMGSQTASTSGTSGSSGWNEREVQPVLTWVSLPCSPSRRCVSQWMACASSSK